MSRDGKIAVLTSGGDSPGMNACLRAITRWGLHRELLVYGVRNGYAGLLAGEWEVLTARDVGGILHRGGTMLGTARCEELKDPARQTTAFKRAFDKLTRDEIGNLIVLGGDGSLTAALELHRRFEEKGLRVIGIPATIDNDLAHTEASIGVDTALNIILQAVDRIKDTADAMGRCFLVEVMGGKSGYLAAASGLTCGAEMVLRPDVAWTLDDLIARVCARMSEADRRRKSHFVIIVAEQVLKGAFNGRDIEGALKHRYAEKTIRYEPRWTVLGHQQRGGTPTHGDRFLATQLAVAAVEQVRQGKGGVMVGWMHGAVRVSPLEDVIRDSQGADPNVSRLAGTPPLVDESIGQPAGVLAELIHALAQ